MKKMFTLKWWEVAIVASILLAGMAYGQWASETITVNNTVKTLTAATYGPAPKKAYISCESHGIFYTVDGVSVPTTISYSGVGHELREGERVWLSPDEIKNFKAIRAGYQGTSILKVTYY